VPRQAQPRQNLGDRSLGSVASALNLDPYSFKARFGDLIASTGVTIVPRALFFYSGELGLSYADVGFVGHILSYRWTTTVPFPSQGKLAQQAGLTRRGLRLRVMALKSLGYLRVVERFAQEGRQTSNGYDFSPLLARLNELIRRDWESVWKHRDPLVAAEDDGVVADGDISVDKPPPVEVSFRGERERNYRGEGVESFRGERDRSFRLPESESASEEDSVKKEGQGRSGNSDRKEDSRTSSLRATRTSDIPSPARQIELPHDPSIDRAIADYSDQFGDRPHLAANQTRAHRLWRQTRLESREFLDVLYVAGGRTASHLGEIEGTETDGIHRHPKAMPYYLGVVKGVLRERGWTIEEKSTSPSIGPFNLSALQQALGRRVEPKTVSKWLDGARVLDWDPGEKRLTLGIRDPAGLEQLTEGYGPILQRTAAELAGIEVRVDITRLAM
jgi:hypothetical protein